MLSKEEIREIISKVLRDQKFGIFTSISELNDPHPTLVAYNFSSDLKEIVFATPQGTRKFKNVVLHPNVSFFWDSRTNSADDVKNAFTITAIGKADVLPDERLSRAKKEYLSRHPYMGNFIESATTKLIAIKVKRFELVSQFQNVLDYTP